MRRRSILLAVACALLFSAPASASHYASQVANTSGLVSHWRLGEASGQALGSSAAFHGTVYNASRAVGGLLTNDTNAAIGITPGTTTPHSRVAVPDSDSLDFAATYSTELWYRPTRVPLAAAHNLLAKTDSYFTSVVAGPTRWKTGFLASDGAWVVLQATTGPAAGTRYHVVTTFDGATLRLYVNGALTATLATTRRPAKTTTPLNIGAWSEWGDSADGTLDEVAVYSSTLAAATVKGHYDAGIELDTTAPDTVIESGPANPTNQTSATFGFRSTEAGSTFECQLDAGAWEQACTSPKTYPTVAAGSHTFSVRARDAAGNLDATPATHTWTVDTTPPSVAITGGPAGTVSSPSAQFVFSGEAGAALACSLDTGAFEQCTSPRTITVPCGPHTFRVRATDAAGNTATASRTWTVETYECAVAQTAGVVSHWKLDEASGTIAADRIGPNPGTYRGTVGLGQPALINAGTAAAFSGGADVRVPDDDTTLDATNAFTIEAWIKPTTGAGASRNVLAKAGAYYMALNPEGRVSLGYTTGGRLIGRNGGPKLAAGVPHHVVGTYDGAFLRTYIDGYLADEYATTGAVDVSAVEATIASWQGGDPFGGTIDEVALYRSALDLATVHAHYRAAGKSLPTHRVARGLNTTLGWGNWGTEERATEIRTIVQSGAAWAKVDLSWSSFEELGKGTINTGYFNWVLSQVRELETAKPAIKILVAVTQTPPWARTATCPHASTAPGDPGKLCAPRSAADYGDAIKVIAQQFVQAGVPIDAYMVWNEPNLKRFWLPAADPTAYAAVLKAGYAGVKAVNPTAKVVFGGLSNLVSTDGTNIDRYTFVDQAQGPNDDLEAHYDVMSVHPYACDDPPETIAYDSTTGRMRPGSFASYREIRKLTMKPIWFTEFGWSTVSPSGGTCGVTEAKQADYLTRALRFVQQDDYVQAAFWYQLRNNPYGASGALVQDEDTWEGRLGLTNTAMTIAKPAFAQFQAPGA